jgi:hypothetical protein
MNKLIKHLVKKLKFIWKINNSSFNKILNTVISSNSTRIRNKIKWVKLKRSIFDSIIAIGAGDLDTEILRERVELMRLLKRERLGRERRRQRNAENNPPSCKLDGLMELTRRVTRSQVMLCWQHSVLLRSFQEARESVELERLHLTLHKKCPLGSKTDYGRIDIEKWVRNIECMRGFIPTLHRYNNCTTTPHMGVGLTH